MKILLKPVLGMLVLSLCVLGSSSLLFLASKSLVPDLKQEVRIEKDAAVLLGEIKSQFKIVTASRTSQQLVTGYTQSGLPFSKEEIVYSAVYTAEASIDLSSLSASDLTIVDKTVYIELPKPVIRLILDEKNSQVLSKDSQPFSGPWVDINLLKKIQLEARQTITKQIESEGSLQREAIANGEKKLSELLGALGYKVVYGRFVGPLPPVAAIRIPPHGFW